MTLYIPLLIPLALAAFALWRAFKPCRSSRNDWRY